MLTHNVLWNLSDMVKEYDSIKPEFSGPEGYLVNEVAKLYTKNIKDILVIGCGTGREVLPLYKKFPDAYFSVNDISANMLEQASKNFIAWGFAKQVNIINGPIEKLNTHEINADLVTCFGNVLNYVLTNELRNNVFRKLYKITNNDGFVLGMVHQVKGTFLKSSFFSIKKMLRFILKGDWQNRVAGRKGEKYLLHYYTRKELHSYLSDAGFKDIKILSLKEYYAVMKRKYDSRRGTNNFIFYAKNIK